MVQRPTAVLRVDRAWQWAWDRYGPRYSWAVFVLGCAIALPIFTTVAFAVAALEKSDRFVAVATLAAVIALVASYFTVRPGLGAWRPVESWAAGGPVDRREALESTYEYARAVPIRGVFVYALSGGSLAVGVGVISGMSSARLVQVGFIGVTLFAAVILIGIHAMVEMWLRPCRVAIAADADIGDSLPRSRPTFGTWSNVAVIAAIYTYCLSGAVLAVAIDRTDEDPVIAVVIAAGLTLFFAVPITVGIAFAPQLRPIRDLAEGTKRVAAGDYTQRLPVVQDDDLGALSASFNRMQAGLVQRERLRAAFGSYVDPALATRLLDQGDDMFTGERLDVTVMFVDIRDFTPFAEANTAEDTVTRLNALFDIVVPAVLGTGGHVNKYLGDGALAVFGAPNVLTAHADAAVAAALQIQQLVAERFAGDLRIGIGINTGQVIAGTIGGAGKLEFTLIGDTVNVAARVEQLTKTTGDTILVTEQTLLSVTEPPANVIDRGLHDLKGKAATVHVHAIN